MEKVYARIESGETRDTPGLLEQWLREGKLSLDQAIAEASAMFSTGVDTVSNLADIDTHLASSMQSISKIKGPLSPLWKFPTMFTLRSYCNGAVQLSKFRVP